MTANPIQIREAVVARISEPFCTDRNALQALMTAYKLGQPQVIHRERYQGCNVFYTLGTDRLIKSIYFDIGLLLQVVYLDSTPERLFKEVGGTYGMAKRKDFSIAEFTDLQTPPKLIAAGTSGADRDIFVTKAAEAFRAKISLVQRAMQAPEETMEAKAPDPRVEVAQRVRSVISERAMRRLEDFDKPTANIFRVIAREFVRPFVMRGVAEQQHDLTHP